jgi:hypothetical protein
VCKEKSFLKVSKEEAKEFIFNYITGTVNGRKREKNKKNVHTDKFVGTAE